MKDAEEMVASTMLLIKLMLLISLFSVLLLVMYVHVDLVVKFVVSVLKRKLPISWWNKTFNSHLRKIEAVKCVRKIIPIRRVQAISRMSGIRENE